MFEEAEEIAKDIYIHHFDDDVNYPDVLKAITVGVQKGAEHGYNKAKEWHYVKDGDLPKHEVNVLVLFNEQCIDIAHYNWDYKEWHFTDSIVRDVIAWKEIVLPKEIENA